jgi:hypothetical protein
MKVKIKSLKFLILIKRSIYYDIEKSQYGLPTNLTFYQTLIRWSQFLVAAPISLILWVVFRAISRQYKISIYVLSTFRPGIASMYLSLIEPVCRQLQYDKTPKRYTILVNPGENISDVLRDSYAPHLSKNTT